MGGEQEEQWLPVGWKIRVRVRTSGRKDKKCKCIFTSKWPRMVDCQFEAFDRKHEHNMVAFLLSCGASGRRNKQKGPGFGLFELKEKPEDGGLGQKGKRSIFIFGRYYVNPSNGLKFSSKPEVLRYLTCSGKDRKHKELAKTDFKKTVVEQLPPGWIKEIRTKKKGSKMRRDLCYIDPVSGRHFRSMPEVFRYIESKESREAVSKSNAKGHVTAELGDHSKSSSGEAKGQRSIDKKADAHSTRNRSVKSVPKVVGPTKVDVPVLEQRDKEDGFVAGNLPNKSPEVVAKERVNGVRRRSMRLSDIKQNNNVTEDQSSQSGSDVSAEKIISLPESNGLEQIQKENSKGEGRQLENLALQKKRKSPNSKCTSGLPPRTSKRLAREEIKHPSPEIKTSNQSGVSATMSDESEVTTPKNVGKEGPLDEPLIDHATGKNSNDSNENPASNQETPISHDCKEDDKRSRNHYSSLEGLLMDPCIEFAVKTLTGAIPIEEVNKVGDSPVTSLSLPNQTSAPSYKLPPGHNIWADPCFEFAVNMLTGEMPTEDGSRFHLSLQQPLGSSYDVRKESLFEASSCKRSFVSSCSER